MSNSTGTGDRRNIDTGIANLLREAYVNGECPPAESWIELLEGSVEPEHARWMETHAAACAACAAERALCEAFVSESGDNIPADDVQFVVDKLASGKPASAKVVSIISRRMRMLQPVLGLAAAAALVLAVLPVLGPMFSNAPTLPAPEAGSNTRGTQIMSIEPAGDVASLPLELRWEPHAGAASYRATLRTVDDAVLWQDTIPPANRIGIPDAAREKMHTAVVYLWQVEALDALGNRMAASKPEPFRVWPGEQR